MRINHNIASLNTYRQLSNNSVMGNKSLEKLSSGLRINRAGDDAAGLAISEKMRGQIRGLSMASKNAQDSISLIQTAEGALAETQSILQRMRELAVQASSDTNVGVDREKIQQEMNQLTSEINRIGNTTEFNTQKLINGDKVNTFTTVVTVSAVVSSITISSATTVSVALGAGVDTADVAGVISSGMNTITLSVERNDRTADTTVTHDAAVSYTSGGTTTIDWNGDITFAASVAAGGAFEQFHFDGATSAAVTWTITRTTADTVTITNGQAGTANATSVVEANSAGFTFSDFGMSFDIDDFGNLTVGETISFTALTAAGTVSTALSNGTLTGVNADAATTIGVSGAYTAQAQAGTYTFTFDTAGQTWTLSATDTYNGFTITEMTFTNAQAQAGFSALNTYGISFKTGNMATVSGALTYEFEITDTYSVDASINGGAATTVIADYDGASTAAQTFTFTGGLTFSNDGTITNGTTITFAAVDEVTEVTTTAMAGSDVSLNFQIGANQGQAMNLEINDMRAKALSITATAAGSLSFVDADGVTSSITLTSTMEITDGTSATGEEYGLDLSTYTNATKAITVLNNAIETVSEERSKLGGYQNRLEHTIANLDTSAENLQASESRIRDVDMAKEMMEFTKNNILMQAAQAMLAQANQQPQGVLQLLR